MTKKISDEEFIRLWNRYKSGKDFSEAVGLSLRQTLNRRRSIEKRRSITLTSDDPRSIRFGSVKSGARAEIKVDDAVIMVGADAHYWPDIVTAGHRGFVKVCKLIHPQYVVMNGDMFDLPSISRFPRIGWEHQPQIKKELEAVQDRLEEIEKASPGAKFFWPLGNHDARFETRLAQIAPEYEGVHGMTLKDHFPRWIPCWSVMINNRCIIKHRWHAGIHAVYNNTIKGGVSIITAHQHSLKVTPWTDYTGSRYGVDCGTLADPFGPEFEGYMEDNARNWRAGFAVLTFKSGVLMPPELAHVIDDKIWFRGNQIDV